MISGHTIAVKAMDGDTAAYQARWDRLMVSQASTGTYLVPPKQKNTCAHTGVRCPVALNVNSSILWETYHTPHRLGGLLRPGVSITPHPIPSIPTIPYHPNT